MFAKMMRRLEAANPVVIGVVLLLCMTLAGTALFRKTQIATALKGGETIEASFDRDYRLRAHVTKVKVAGVPVGLVTDVERGDDGEFTVEMKVDDGTRKILGSAPSASVRPTTLMGGNYFVELEPGGKPSEFHGTIPASRTTTPVELDRVLEVLNPEVRDSLPRTVRRLDGALDKRGQRAVRRLVDVAPDALEPGALVLNSLRGTRPDQDLQNLVSDLETLATGLSTSTSDLSGAVDGLATTSRLLAETRGDTAAAVDSLPDSLRTARTGLHSLDGTLDELRETADSIRPAASELDTLLENLDPALKTVRPVVRDLRPTLVDLRPLVEDLLPTVTTGTRVLDDVDGDPLARVNGPVMDAVLSPWRGSGDYAYSGDKDTPLYKELGSLIAGMNNAARMTDKNGGTIHFQPGFGVGSVSGTPISFERLLHQLLYPQGDR